MNRKIDKRTLLKGAVAAFVAVPFGVRAASHAGKEHMVNIVGFAFDPPALDVQVGDTITWTNKDSAPHTASADDGSWATGTLRKNESASVVVTNGMSGDYHCKFHPSMTAQLMLGMG